ncbi:MAG: protein-tyrosine phosphatase [Sphingobacteriales bacterium]|jgi:protein-tyrosine phosphatase
MAFSFFNKKIEFNFENLGVDMHSHLIPGIDDGATDLENSIQLIRGLKEVGFKKLITTPHIMADYYQNTPEIILRGLDKVRNELASQGVDIEMDASAEYYFDENLTGLIKSKRIIPLHKKYLLFELSYINVPNGLPNLIFDIQNAGYIPVLAHPERYPFYHDKFEEYEAFVEKGCLLQLNFLSLSGNYGPGVKKIAQKLLEKNLISFISTDLHNQRHMDKIKNNITEKKIVNQIKDYPFLNKNLL